MTNYNESTIAGTKWTRCNKIVINNPYKGGLRSAVFYEEDAVAFDGDAITKPTGTCAIFFNPAEYIQLYDPITGDLTMGTMSHEDLYKILYSFYRDTANKRDLGVPQPPIV